ASGSLQRSTIQLYLGAGRTTRMSGGSTAVGWTRLVFTLIPRPTRSESAAQASWAARRSSGLAAAGAVGAPVAVALTGGGSAPDRAGGTGADRPGSDGAGGAGRWPGGEARGSAGLSFFFAGAPGSTPESRPISSP